MRAQVLTEPAPISERPLKLQDLEVRSPEPGEVRVEVRACGVCRTDLHVVEGELDLGRQRKPVIPGHQVVGVVAEAGLGAQLKVGARVGVAWLGCTCGGCRFCARGDENLCERAEFTGYTVDGGYAEQMLAPADFVYALPDALGDVEVAPLLCAGIIGHRCLSACDLDDWSGARIGLYGFGAAGHIAIQIARARGAEVYVATRDREKHQALAEELGATWVGGSEEAPPVPLDASIIFAPAGPLVPRALKALDRGGRLVLGGIHMSEIPAMDYQDLYWERVVRSVANSTRDDGRAFLEEAANIGVKTHTQVFPLAEANEALHALKHGAVRGAAVLVP